MQTKEIKLNISYIVLGLLAIILLFVGLTSVAHAQMDINNKNKILVKEGGELTIGILVQEATAHYCVVLMLMQLVLPVKK